MSEKQPSWTMTALVDDLPATERSLVLSTLQELHGAELPTITDALTRVFAPISDDGPAGDARERRLVNAQGALQPFVELLLRELTWLATVPGWSVAMRTERATEAIALAGF